MRLPLFFKIFLGFWLVTAAILGSWQLANQYFESHPVAAQQEPPKPGRPPHRLLLRLMYSLQNAPREELPQLIASVKDKADIDVYLIQANGEELLGQDVPAAAREAAQRLRGKRQRINERGPDGHLLAHEIYRRDTGPLKVVAQLPPPRHRVLGIIGRSPGLRLLLALLVSGIVCYALSRLVTRRLKALQGASRQLARGDLDTRLQVRDSGGDETDELARDFNSMASRLQERMDAQQRLLRDVSHELRSPLARLRVALALAQQRGEDNEQLARIEQEVERLEALIAQLLEDSRELQLDRHLDLVPLLQELCDDAGFEGRPAGKEVVFSSELETALVASGGDLLHSSFDNVLRNALAHTADDSRVDVTLWREGDRFVLRFEDEGPGVPEAELEQIFGEFYRTDSARSRDRGGYGMGLAIARRAIVRHGGSITARNSRRGLAVTVELPAGD